MCNVSNQYKLWSKANFSVGCQVLSLMVNCEDIYGLIKSKRRVHLSWCSFFLIKISNGTEYNHTKTKIINVFPICCNYNFTDFLSKAMCFQDFFSFKSCKSFDTIYEKIWHIILELRRLIERYVTGCWLNIQAFSRFVYKTYGEWLLSLSSIFDSKIVFFLLFYAIIFWYLLIFNNKSIPIKKKQ